MTRLKTFIHGFVVLLIYYSIISCSKAPIYRDGRGHRIYSRSDAVVAPVKKKVALLKFFNEAPYGGDDLSVSATEELRHELSRTKEFVVDSSGNKIFGTSKEIYSGGGMKLVQLARKAKLSGINFVLFGRIISARVKERTDEIGIVRKTKSYTEAKVEMRIFDVFSNKEIFNQTFDGFARDNTYRFFMEKPEERLIYRQELLRYGVKVAVRRGIPQIMGVASRLNWTGRVAKIIGTKIYINAGRDAGLEIGDILRVMTEGEDIFDPETGALMGVSKGQIKGTLEIVEFFGPDGTIAVLHSGGAVSEGDFVQLY